jgi:hypothetical protein
MTHNLEPGDFLYQSDQELFLVVVERGEESFKFAVHGWRDIDTERVEEYIEDSRSNMHEQDEIEGEISENGDDETREQFNKLKQLFSVYEQADLPDEGPQEDFTLEE